MINIQLLSIIKDIQIAQLLSAPQRTLDPGKNLLIYAPRKSDESELLLQCLNSGPVLASVDDSS